MAQNLRAIVRYDGTDFAGWQIQPDRPTVQGELERVLSLIAREPIRVYGAGRTDAGVHATGQVCSFIWPDEPDMYRIGTSVSQLLRPAIRMDHLDRVPDEFHARHSARAKRYVYAIAKARMPDPFTDRFALNIADDIALERIESLATPLLGEHDFAGYQCTGSEMSSTVREIYGITVKPGGFVTTLDSDKVWRIEFHGSGFLYKMVRNLVGTFLEVLTEKVAPDAIADRLNSAGPYRGYTAPAKGLCLANVYYDDPLK